MSYKVTGAAAVVELNDGNADLGTGPRVYLEQDGTVPENAKAKHVEHLVNVGLVEQVKASEPSADDKEAADKAQAEKEAAEKAAADKAAADAAAKEAADKAAASKTGGK